MATLKPEIMQKFISILEEKKDTIEYLLGQNGWGEAEIEINKHAELYAYPSQSSPAASRINRIFVTPRISNILRVRITVAEEEVVAHVGRSLSSVVPKLTSKGMGSDDLGKTYIEYEVSLPASFMASKTAESDFVFAMEPVLSALATVWESNNCSPT